MGLVLGDADDPLEVTMDRRQVARVLEEVGSLLELRGENPFKVRAYSEGARILEGLDADLAEIVAEGKLRGIKGIGPGLAADITELVTTGELKLLDDLHAEFPEGVRELLAIPGLGPKKIRTLREQLHVGSVGELEYACKENRLVGLPGFGAKTQEKVLKGIALFQASKGRFLYGDAAPVGQALLAVVRKDPAVQRVELAGSLRRRRETVKDLDLVASSDRPEEVMDRFGKLPGVAEVVASGPTKTTVRLENGLSVDLRVVADDQFATALHHFTGSSEHNTQLRGLAKAKGFKINEYGLWKVDDGHERLVPVQDEAGLFRELGLADIPPELREGRGELDEAARGAIPELVSRRDLRGTFHCHTLESDGTATLEAMVKAAKALGFEYLGVSDHSEAAAYAHGLTRDRIGAQHEAIDALNARLDGIQVLKGIEADILRDGSIDYDPATLSSFDFVIASIHSRFGMDGAPMTERILRAIEDPHVTMLGHLTGRLLLARDPYDVDLDAIFRHAAKHGVIVEVNSHPNRLDVDWRFLRRAVELGVLLCINPDAHSTEGLSHVDLGVGIARKGWVTPEHVFNTRSLAEVKQHLEARKAKARALAR